MPLRCDNRSCSVALAVTYGSPSLKSGFHVFTGSVHVACSAPTTPAMTVDATGFDTDATSNTVSASTFSGAPTLRTP
jgi:hypothetical protein